MTLNERIGQRLVPPIRLPILIAAAGVSRW